jgi:hypothetical protein
LCAFIVGLGITLLTWAPYWFWAFQAPARITASRIRHDVMVMTLGWIPFVAMGITGAAAALIARFRSAPVVVIATERPTTLHAKFLEQDQRLQRQEELKRQVLDNEFAIETFFAEMKPDERRAWDKRGGHAFRC